MGKAWSDYMAKNAKREYDESDPIKIIDQLRAELSRLQRNEDCVNRLIAWATENGWNGVDNSKILDVFISGLVDQLRAELAAAKEEHTALAAHIERLVGALSDVLDAVGALGGKAYELEGYGINAERAVEIIAALAATPAQSLAAHEAAVKEPSPFLSRAAWRVVKEVWVDVAAGRMNARSAIADAALDLRGLLEESGPEPSDEVVGVLRKAETTFGGYLAAHDAVVKVAVLREVAEKWEKRGDDCLKRASVNLRATADRIEKGEK